MRKVEVLPVVIETLQTVTTHFEKWIEQLDLAFKIEALQKPCLLGKVRIIRKVLDMKRGKKGKKKEATVPKTTG